MVPSETASLTFGAKYAFFKFSVGVNYILSFNVCYNIHRYQNPKGEKGM